MKTVILFLIMAQAALADVTLRFTHFHPAEGRIDLYVSEDGFDRTQPVSLASLSAPQQAAVGSALAWLATQLPAGFSSLDRVVLEPGAPFATAWDEDGQPTAWTRTLNAAVTGSGAKGSRTITIIGGDSPEQIRAGLLAIWDALEAGQNP
jgi:ethanolamine utilization microcompartment shell protein EutL